MYSLFNLLGLYLWLTLVWCGARSADQVDSWGFQPHKLINRHAIFTLPPAMITFYKYHINYLSEQAVAADRRRYAVAAEGPRHYIDLDYYGVDVPRYWEQLLAEFNGDSIQEHGLLPWHLVTMKSSLIQAFREKNARNILRISADAGHYISDAHVPLHTTSNYNGQFTGQQGIHGFWETRVPELLIGEFDLWVGKASYRRDWYRDLWEIIIESHRAVDSVLHFERALTGNVPEHLKYSYELRLNRITRVYSAQFTSSYHKVLNRQTERRMRAAIKAVGDFWYTCWVESGQPDLLSIIPDNASYTTDYQNVEDSVWRHHVLFR